MAPAFVIGHALGDALTWRNCETQHLKMIRLELYEIIERFWRDRVYCQYVIVVLVQAWMDLVLKCLWKLTVFRKREYSVNRVNTLRQNTEHKVRQL